MEGRSIALRVNGIVYISLRQSQFDLSEFSLYRDLFIRPIVLLFFETSPGWIILTATQAALAEPDLEECVDSFFFVL